MINKAMAHVWSKQTRGVTWSRWCGIRECSLLSCTVIMILGLWRRKCTSNTLVGCSLNEKYTTTCQSGFIVEKHCKVFQRQRGLRQGIRSSCDHGKDWRSEKEATTSRIVGPPCARWIWSSGSCNCPRGVKGAGNHPRSYRHSAGPRAGGWRLNTLTPLQGWCACHRLCQGENGFCLHPSGQHFSKCIALDRSEWNLTKRVWGKCAPAPPPPKETEFTTDWECMWVTNKQNPPLRITSGNLFPIFRINL